MESPHSPTGGASALTRPALPAPPDSISSYEAQLTSLKQERQQQQQDLEEKERELGRLKQLLSRAHPLDSLEKQMEKVGVGMDSPHPHPGIWKGVEAAKGDCGARGLLGCHPIIPGSRVPSNHSRCSTC